MIRVRTLISLQLVLTVCVWPTAVLAATLTFGQEISSISPKEWAIWLLLTTLSGATALLNRVSTHYNDAPPDMLVVPIRNLPLLAAAHMAGSWLAGLLAFFAAAAWGWPGLAIGFVVPTVSFGGARACEVIYNKTMGKLP